MLAAQDVAHGVGESRIARQQNKDTAEVIAERPFVAIGYRLERGERDIVNDHLVESTPHQIRMPAQEFEEALDLRRILER